jgi:DNA repair protein RadC
MYKAVETTIMTLNEAALTADQRMTSPREIADYCADLQTASQEQMVILTFNIKHRLIDRHLVSLGTLNSSLVHPREVFRPAILDCAASIVMVHNHPSGDPSPSANDVTITRKIKEAGKVLEIEVSDSVIIGRKHPDFPHEGFASMRDMGLMY